MPGQILVRNASSSRTTPRASPKGRRKWRTEGRPRVDVDIQHGLENAYDAFMRLFSGGNSGKLVLKIA